MFFPIKIFLEDKMYKLTTTVKYMLPLSSFLGLIFFLTGCDIKREGTAMLDHVSISVNDYEKNLIFYDQTLETLGYQRIFTIDIPEQEVKTAGYGKGGKPSFWISPMGKKEEEVGRARGVHFAFLAPNSAAVDAWHKKCLELGGTDNGAPGPRPHYHPGYYGAFIIDPSGWRIEAVFHQYNA